MTDEEFENLAKRYPDLFEKSDITYISCGSGWYNIIDSLCAAICMEHENAVVNYKYARDYPKFNKHPLEHYEQNVLDAKKRIPKIQQVKEKFGSLRFYVDTDSEKIQNYITFASIMSSCTCEICGARGEKRNSGWIKVLCDKHNRETEEKSER